MQPFDLVIRGGTVATATDSFKADVGIRGDKIAAIAEGLDKGSKRSTRAADWCCPAVSTATATSSSCPPPA
jgi:dihydroorotase-like cyclic amidohydrolase